MPEILQRNGVHSHKATDHYHYWEDGGCTYHQRYNTWSFQRGQEGDAWIGRMDDPGTGGHAGRNAGSSKLWDNEIHADSL